MPPINQCVELDCNREVFHKTSGLCLLHHDRKRKGRSNTRDCFHCGGSFPAKRGQNRYCEDCAPQGDTKALQLLGRYGLSKSEFDSMYFEQDGECALAHCHNEAIVVDHKHLCSELHVGSARGCLRCVRALVCQGCNVKLAAIDDTLFLAAAHEFVKEYA